MNKCGTARCAQPGLPGDAAGGWATRREPRLNVLRTPTHSHFALGMYYALKNNWSRTILFENFYFEGSTDFWGYLRAFTP